jgi:hypothetical protein
MMYVPVKTIERKGSWPCIRPDLLVKQQTMLANVMRGLATEFGRQSRGVSAGSGAAVGVVSPKVLCGSQRGVQLFLLVERSRLASSHRRSHRSSIR